MQKNNFVGGQEEVPQDQNQDQTGEGKFKTFDFKMNTKRLTFIVERKWLWAFPQIEGVPPSPRGGHSATTWVKSLDSNT